MFGKRQKTQDLTDRYRQKESQFNPKATHGGNIRVHTHAEEPRGHLGGTQSRPPHTRQNVQHGSNCLPTKDTKNQVKDEK